jgi:hypothetical protein
VEALVFSAAARGDECRRPLLRMPLTGETKLW